MTTIIAMLRVIIIVLATMSNTIATPATQTPQRTYKNGLFHSLTEWKAYSASHPEAFDFFKKQWSNPDITNTILRQSSLLNGIISSFFFKPISWNITYFETSCDQIIAMHSKFSTEQKTSLTISPGSKVFVFGDLHGALDCFVEIIDYLHKRNIIDDQLRIAPNNYFVFLGNVIGGAINTLQLLHLVMTLQLINPENVYYCAGTIESDRQWEGYFAMRKPLQTLNKNSIDSLEDYIPLGKKINKYFSQLPSKVTITLDMPRNPEKKHESIVCAYAMQKNLATLDIAQAVLLGEKVQRVPRGIVYYGLTTSAGLWSLTGGPSYAYKEQLKFYKNSFMEIAIEDQLSESIAIIHERDITTKQPFMQKKYDIVFGTKLPDQECVRALKKLRQNQPYKIGSSLAVYDGVDGAPRGLQKGLSAAFARKNATGGIQETLLQMIVVDDEYLPSNSKKNVFALQKMGVEAILLPQGAKNINTFMSLVKEGKISVFFPRTGEKSLRDPSMVHITNIWASYEKELNALIHFLVKERGMRRPAIIYMRGRGENILDIAHRELQRYGIKECIDLPYNEGETAFEDVVARLYRENPDGIGLFFQPGAGVNLLLSRLKTEFLIGKNLFMRGFLETTLLQEFLKSRGLNTIVTYDTPNPADPSVQIVKEFQDAMGEFYWSCDRNSLQGFIAGELFMEALDKTKKPWTIDGIEKFFTSMNNYAFKGLTLSYKPETRSLEMPVWIKDDENKWHIYKEMIIEKAVIKDAAKEQKNTNEADKIKQPSKP